MAITELTGKAQFVNELPPGAHRGGERVGKFHEQWIILRAALQARPNTWAAILRTDKNGQGNSIKKALGEGFEVKQRRDLEKGDFIAYARYTNGSAPKA